KDLLEIKITGSQDFHELLEEFFNQDNAIKTAFRPENEADAVLLSMVARASQDFLTNPKYGLDYYLSKRIRHQSFIGLIRSHLEFSNLITTRESENKDFEYNHFWVDKFKSLTSCQKNELNDLLAVFAKEFDDKLIDVRDNVFQLYSEECPAGLIKTEFTLKLMSFLKHVIIETNATFHQFAYYLTPFMWAFLQPSLEITKQYIREDLKPSIMHSADKLKANARKLAGEDEAFADFELKLAEKIADVQRSLEDVMSWFTPLVGVSADSVNLKASKVLNLSINAALDMLKPFNPDIEKQIENTGEIELHQEELTFINDTIFILFDNIKAHSGIKKPKIVLKLLIDHEASTITISCENETKQSDRKKLRDEITKIKKMIDEGQLGDRARSEGRSGFFKLAASIDKATKGNLEIDLNSEGVFNLVISTDLNTYETPVEQVEVNSV
ncbi:MAG: hypothetical protein MI867_07695, partial [Pseudomonadales bacterium]|nr:hypothetical protein [Pseudomonadales bacterium]